MEDNEDRQAQLDEMEILSEILDADCFSKFISDGSAMSGQMNIKVHVPWDTLKCKYRTDEDDLRESMDIKVAQEQEDPNPKEPVPSSSANNENASAPTPSKTPKKKATFAVLTLKHLPPLQLHFTLPSDYPSTSKPMFTLSCAWLYRDSLTFLCEKLDSIWEENQGMAVLYTWYSFLQADAITSLGLGRETVYDLSFFCDQQQSFRRPMLRKCDNVPETPITETPGDTIVPGAKNLKKKLQTEDSPVSRKVAKTRHSSFQMQFDPRAVFERAPVPFIQYLMNYDTLEEEAEFARTSHPCAICFTEKRGRDSMLFKCGHIFCKECLKDYFSLHIKEGSLDCVKCPDLECKTVPTPDEVKQVVGEQLFERYDTLLLSKVLDSMSDILVCPRLSCGKPVMFDPAEKLANCASCGYSFCSHCKMVYHGVEPCRLVSGEARQLYEKYTSAPENVKQQLEKTYGKKQLQLLVQQTLSEDWVNSQSKKCPHCQVPIDKFEGCNKVTCFKCATYFCWICSSQLDKQNPYSHFNDPSSPCYNNLFLNVDAGNDEDDDWEILVDNNRNNNLDFDEVDDGDDDDDEDWIDHDEIVEILQDLRVARPNRHRHPAGREGRRAPRAALQGGGRLWIGFRNRALDSDSD